MFACIYIPDFPVEAIVRAEPLLREHAVAVIEGKPPLTRVVALNEKARLLGMETGMTKLQAAVFAETPASDLANSDVPQRRTISSPRLALLRQRSREQEQAAHAALLDVAHSFTPRVEDAAADTLLLDLAGMERLYGTPAKMGTELQSRAAAVGIEGNVALAANPDAAMHAARGFDGITVLPAGSEIQRLGVLPVEVLLDGFEISSQTASFRESTGREREKFREQMLDTLERWGVRDFRTLALLPEHALASRLGQPGAQLRRLARGESTRTLNLCEPAQQFQEAMELESPVENIESLSFVLNRLLEQLCARLEARALAAQQLWLRLQLDRRVADEQTTTVQELNGLSLESHSVIPKPEVERVLRLPLAMRDGKVFLKLLQLDLAAHPPGAPVIKLWISAQPAPPRTAQRGLFLPLSPEPEKLELTLARINAIVGERRAGIARLLDSHRRNSFNVERFMTAVGDISTTSSLTMSEDVGSRLAMRLIRPAYQLTVHLCEGRPADLNVDNGKTEGRNLQGIVLWPSGPWRSSGDWWAENANSGPSGAWDREEWDIAVAVARDGSNSANIGAEAEQNVALYRIYRDIGTGEWFADASYD
jgi:protein ImuB